MEQDINIEKTVAIRDGEQIEEFRVGLPKDTKMVIGSLLKMLIPILQKKANLTDEKYKVLNSSLDGNLSFSQLIEKTDGKKAIIRLNVLEEIHSLMVDNKIQGVEYNANS